MLENNEASNSLNDNELTGSSENQQDPTATPEEIENANKPQPNVILNKVQSGGLSGATRDNNRIEQRANEATDSTDTNTGNLVAGAAKGTKQS